MEHLFATCCIMSLYSNDWNTGPGPRRMITGDVDIWNVKNIKYECLKTLNISLKIAIRQLVCWQNTSWRH